MLDEYLREEPIVRPPEGTVKYSVLRGLSAEALRSAVPARYRPQLPDHLPYGPYTLLLFRSDRRDVVLSRVVRSALAEVAEPAGQLAAVGGCFTAEGLEQLRARRAIILQLAEFHWTDESYQAIREGR
jgi:hypothetical protein